MYATILNGGPADDSGIEAVQAILAEELGGAGWTLEPIVLRDMAIAPCCGCFGCWVQTPGECVIRDGADRIPRALVRSDLAVLLTPVTFGGYSSDLKKALDRSIGLVSPFFMRIRGEVHHRPRYPRYPRLLGVGTLPEPDADVAQLFRSLVQRNALNMHVPVAAAGVVAGGAKRDEIRVVLRNLLASVWVGL